MAYEPKPGSFTLFKNDKGDNANRPDYRGDGLDLNGNPVEVAAWIKEGKFMSCTFKLKEDRMTATQIQAARKNSADIDSDVPF
jgi:hypothetical protein